SPSLGRSFGSFGYSSDFAKRWRRQRPLSFRFRFRFRFKPQGGWSWLLGFFFDLFFKRFERKRTKLLAPLFFLLPLSFELKEPEPGRLFRASLEFLLTLQAFARLPCALGHLKRA